MKMNFSRLRPIKNKFPLTFKFIEEVGTKNSNEKSMIIIYKDAKCLKQIIF
jgi:hypothetical protein